MAEIASMIQNLNGKVDLLIKQCDRLKSENAALEEANHALHEEIEEQGKVISELEEKNEMIKVAGALQGSGEENSEARQKINELVREIDKCIALLNR